MKTPSTRAGLFALALILGALAAIPAHAAQDGPTPYPAPTDEGAWAGVGPIRVFGWMVDNRRWFWTQREKDQGSVVFVGDSLTGNWKIDDMKKAFPKLKIANRGIGGDVSRGVLFRFKEDVLDLKPTAIVLCIGTNDLSAKAKPELVEQNIVSILAQTRVYSATMPIVLCQIPPRDSASAPTDPGALADLNARIAKIGASEKNLAVLDLFAAMSTPDGKPVPEYFTKDKLHPAPAGYEKWAQVMQPVFDKLGVK